MRGVSRDAVCERCVRRGREVDSGPAAMDTEEGTPLVEEREGECGWRATLARRLPVLRWARRYTRAAAAADAVAGVTLGLMLVPQSIAYAALADLPAQYGLYSAFIGLSLTSLSLSSSTFKLSLRERILRSSGVAGLARGCRLWLVN
ncbi:Sulfate permease 2 [Papilio machaon]|uniref:Sulfate permease 2 n=1 Tax=Papilio machaon TaxID=76193 RepID=A0A194R934_PAPMA|nr:Sulfate permease 2 [Papilio machaon]